MNPLTGIRINTRGELHTFNYIPITDLIHLEEFVEERGDGELITLEVFGYNNKQYIVKGYTSGNNFNRFELFYYNSCGDIIIYAANNDNLPVDAVERDIISYYNRSIDLYGGDFLEDDISNDEDYEYNDFVVPDEEPIYYY